MSKFTTVKMFKASARTNRFRENQKVWIIGEFSNYFHIKFKWRGKGRYVTGKIPRDAPSVGCVKEMIVNNDFYERLIA